MAVEQAKVLRVTCPQHGIVYERVFAPDDSAVPTTSGTIQEYVEIVVSAHRASYGAQCPSELRVDLFDGERPPVWLLWFHPYAQQGMAQYPKELLGVFASEADVHKHVEHLNLPQTLVMGDRRVRVSQEELEIEEHKVLSFIDEPEPTEP